MSVYVPVNVVYYTTTKDNNGYFYLNSLLVEQWIHKQCDVVVLNKETVDSKTPECTLLTPFELSVEAERMQEKHISYQLGEHTMLKFKWLTDHRIEVGSWERQLLKRFHPDWFNILAPHLLDDYFSDLNKIHQKNERKNYVVHPVKEKVYRAFEYNPYDTKVVIVGQDCYPSKHACGLAFATEQSSLPPSLKHIKSAVVSKESHIFDPTLQMWAEQGVMLLNTALSVRDGDPGSYLEDWKQFIEEVIFQLSRLPQRIVFIFMGKKAQSFAGLVSEYDHLVLNVEHPAAAAHANREWQHQDVFNRTNKDLKEFGRAPINWVLDF